MPELPEVEATRRELLPAMQDARFERVTLHRGDLRTRFPRRFRARLEGCRVEELARRARYLLAHLSSGETLLMHLGMSGSFRVEYDGNGSGPATDAGRHDHVVFAMSSHATVFFNDPAALRLRWTSCRPASSTPIRRSAGLDRSRCRPEFDGAALAAACRGKKVSLKVALMDQRVVAGLGNIYVSEALHLARLSPHTESVDDSHRHGRAPRRGAPARRGHQAGARRGRSNGRPARSTGRRGSVSTTAKASAAVSAAARVDPKTDAGRPLDVLLRALPALALAARLRAVPLQSQPAMPGHQCYHCKQWVEEGEAHDCWTTTEAALTRDLSEDLQEAYERLRESAMELGEQRVYASHHSIMFARKACYFFVRPKKSFLEVCLFLGRPVKAPQIKRVENPSRAKVANLVHVRHRDEVEAPLTDWLREAYELPDRLAAAGAAGTGATEKTRTARKEGRHGEEGQGQDGRSQESRTSEDNTLGHGAKKGARGPRR